MRTQLLKGGRGRSALVSLETQHIANEDSLLEGRKREGMKREGRVDELHKRRLNDWREEEGGAR
jgi:hypothetical protein